MYRTIYSDPKHTPVFFLLFCAPSRAIIFEVSEGNMYKEVMCMNKSKFPPNWVEKRIQEVLAHYESQSEEEAVAEDEAAYEDTSQTTMEIPNDLVPIVRELIAKRAG